MKRFSIGRSITDAFQLIGHRPLDVLAWGALLAVPYVLMTPLYVSIFGSIPWGMTDSEAMSELLMGEAMRFQALSNLVTVIQLVIGVIVAAAVMRAVLAPERSKAFHLRAGLDEVRLAVVWVAVFIGLALALFVLMLIMLAVGFGFGQAGEATGVMAVLLMAPLLIAAVILGCAMISLMGPATLDTSDFGFVSGWRAARASWGRLCGLVIALFLILIVLQMIMIAVLFGLGALAWTAGLLGDVDTALTDPASWRIDNGRLAGLIALFFVPVAVMSGILQVVMLAPFASAWRQIVESRRVEGAPDAGI